VNENGKDQFVGTYIRNHKVMVVSAQTEMSPRRLRRGRKVSIETGPGELGRE
jgi:hypothetical protein